MKKLKFRKTTNTIACSVLICLSMIKLNSAYCQEEKKDHKIKSDGEFEFSFTFLDTELKGIYKGDYFKSKIEGEKHKIPHGVGILEVKLPNNTSVDCGRTWEEGKLNGMSLVQCDKFQFEGKVKASLPDSGSVEYIYSTDYLMLLTDREQKKLPKTYVGTFLNGKYLKGHYMNVYGDDYWGEFKDGVFDGMGKMDLLGSRIYEGQFKNGLKNGKGKVIVYENTFIECEYLNDELVGDVTIKYYNGDIYAGSIVDFMPSGKGKYMFKTGEVYEGDFLYGKFEGNGIFKTNDRTVKSAFKDGKSIGRGNISFNDGAKYEGELMNLNIPNGKGKMLYANGDFEEGNFEKGIFKEGEIRYTINNAIWEGPFAFSEETGVSPNDKGKIMYSNGNVFEGEWVVFANPKTLKADNCQGECHHFDVSTFGVMEEGTLKLPNNETYTGNFDQRTGLPNGSGKITYSDGRKVKGKFLNGTILQQEQETQQEQTSADDEYSDGTFQGEEEQEVHLEVQLRPEDLQKVKCINLEGDVVVMTKNEYWNTIVNNNEDTNIEQIECKKPKHSKPYFIGRDCPFVDCKERFYKYRKKNKKNPCYICLPMTDYERKLLKGEVEVK